MKSQALKTLVKSIFSDENIKKQFISNPEGVISQFKLNRNEKKAVLATYAKVGLVSSENQQLDDVVGPLTNWW